MDALTGSISSMDFLKRRKQSKWHLEIDKVVGKYDHSKIALSLRDGGQFPQASLRAVTRKYLGSKKRTQQELDEKLENLINSYPKSRLTAFVACATELSFEALHKCLDRFFPVHTRSLNGLDTWLEAFVGAARSRTDLLSNTDRVFATAMIPVAHDSCVGRNMMPNMAVLFDSWNLNPPMNSAIVEHARSLTQRVLPWMVTDLNQFQRNLDLGIINRANCTSAIHYNGILARSNVMDARLLSLLDQNLSDWRRWAAWRPNAVRLLKWMDHSNNSSFRSLIALEGPDNALEDDKRRNTLWRGLIGRRGLLHWFEMKGYTPAIGLITDDTEVLQTAFVEEFMDAAALSAKTKFQPLLEYLIARDGLDAQPVKLWKAIQSLVQLDFIALLLHRREALSPDADWLLTRGLRDMARDVTDSVRRPLAKEVVQCIKTVLGQLLQEFHLCLSDQAEWLEAARRVWRLRSAIGEAGWLHSHLEANFVQTCKSQASEHNITALHYLQVQIEGRSSTVVGLVAVYIRSYITEGRCIADEQTALVEQLHTTWMCSPSYHTREMALAIVVLETISQPVRSRCIKTLPAVSSTAALSLREDLSSVVQGQLAVVVSLTDTVTAISSSCYDSGCWTALLVSVMNHLGITIQDIELTSLGFSTYSAWIELLFNLVGGALDELEDKYSWIKALKQYEATIVGLEALPDADICLTSALVVCRKSEREDHLDILHRLQDQVDNGRRDLMQHLYLTLGKTDLPTVSKTTASIHVLSDVGFAKCQDLMTSCLESREAASVRLCIWLRATMLETDTEDALLNLGQVLKLGVDRDTTPPRSSLKIAQKYYAKRVAKMVATTQMLERNRMVLKRSQPKAVQSMMDDLGLEQARGVELLMADLPSEVVSFVDVVSDNEIELTFPLSDSELNAVQRLAFGLTSSETLSVHLRVSDDSKIDGFCVHVNERGSEVASKGGHSWLSSIGNLSAVDLGRLTEDMGQSYYEHDHVPSSSYCYGRQTRLAYVVSTWLWRFKKRREIECQGELSIKLAYEVVQKALRLSATECVTCGSGGGGSAKLHRPTICAKKSCLDIYNHSNLDMRMQDVRTDGRAFDLLLSAVFATASGGDFRLLPNCPDQINDSKKLVGLLNKLPSTKELAEMSDLSLGLRRHGERAVHLLSWMCTSYRGFLISAQGRYKIPNMPNVHQFLLVNASPELEARFALHNHLQPRRILYHGTSMARLYAILTEGARILSGSDLMAHAATYGRGIYLAREPRTAWGYATACSSRDGTSFFSSRPDFKDAEVVLGCEHAGNNTNFHGKDIHVITDESRVMVRYIFVMKAGTPAPRAQDINPAMMSTFNYLRSSAVGSRG